MKLRPILFQDDMVRSILAGTKHQTRRLLKPQPGRHWDGVKAVCQWYCPTKVKPDGDQYPGKEVFGFANEDEGFVCKHGGPGDRLFVRESHSYDETGKIIFRSTTPDELVDSFKWKPSIYHPKELSRITLELTEVRAERLQEITEADALDEGIIEAPTDSTGGRMTAVQQYRNLWDSINGKPRNTRSHHMHPVWTWDTNPWVWVESFKVI